MSDTFSFEALESLREYLTSISQNHVATMAHYSSADGRGFWHQPSKRERASRASTATCVSSLVRAGHWGLTANRPWGPSEQVADKLIQKEWESAGLDPNNPFTVSFIAEGVLDLISVGAYPGCEEHRRIVMQDMAALLVQAVQDNEKPLAVRGAVSIEPYPPSAYLTQLAFRVLRRCETQTPGVKAALVKSIRVWARSEINRQIALITTASRIADPLQLAYALILACDAAEDEQMSPEEKVLIASSVQIFFDNQQSDGFWRPSQPLFHYPEVGNAQCFEYELLTQLLSCETLKDHLLRYLPNLELIARRLTETYFDLGTTRGSARAIGWASGHHPQIEGPESWSTACVYDFAHSFGRLVAEAARRALFVELKSAYSAPVRGFAPKGEDFAPGFLDAELKIDGQNVGLKAVLRDRFVLPISEDKGRVANGGKLRRTTPMSAILFGPPGTSKTQLAKLISQFLGWPLLSVDPSYLVQDGMDRLYSRANRLFSMLAMAEEIVVLLDEFDEMGRNRANNTELLSRFMTTAMLPKLARINDERKIVFLLATNYVDQFDAAFSRGGRFDMIAQVMPPTATEKLGRPEWKDALTSALDSLMGKQKTTAENILGELTFLEAEQLVARLQILPEDVLGEFNDAKASSTMERKEEEKTWREKCEKDRMLMRIPNPPGAASPKATGTSLKPSRARRRTR